MMRLLKNTLGRRALILSLLGLILSAGTSSAQVPFDMSYQGGQGAWNSSEWIKDDGRKRVRRQWLKPQLSRAPWSQRCRVAL